MWSQLPQSVIPRSLLLHPQRHHEKTSCHAPTDDYCTSAVGRGVTAVRTDELGRWRTAATAQPFPTSGCLLSVAAGCLEERLVDPAAIVVNQS